MAVDKDEVDMWVASKGLMEFAVLLRAITASMDRVLGESCLPWPPGVVQAMERIGAIMSSMTETERDSYWSLVSRGRDGGGGESYWLWLMRPLRRVMGCGCVWLSRSDVLVVRASVVAVAHIAAREEAGAEEWAAVRMWLVGALSRLRGLAFPHERREMQAVVFAGCEGIESRNVNRQWRGIDTMTGDQMVRVVRGIVDGSRRKKGI